VLFMHHPGFSTLCHIGYGGAILPASRLGFDLRSSPVGRLRATALAIMRLGDGLAIEDATSLPFM
jgi:hypothetical protein